MNLRERRIANELAMLKALAECNPDVLRIHTSTLDEFDVTLRSTTGIVQTVDGLIERSEHRMTFRFPRYFPSLPVEAYFRDPVFHPNVDPINGFACLWLEPNLRHNVLDALRIAQALITFRTQNLDPRHIVQPEAVSASNPLPFIRLTCSPDWELLVPSRTRSTPARRRLTPS